MTPGTIINKEITMKLSICAGYLQKTELSDKSAKNMFSKSQSAKNVNKLTRLTKKKAQLCVEIQNSHGCAFFLLLRLTFIRAGAIILLAEM